MRIVFEDEFKHNSNNEKHCAKESIAEIEIDMLHAESAIRSLSSLTADLKNYENTTPATKTKVDNRFRKAYFRKGENITIPTERHNYLQSYATIIEKTHSVICDQMDFP